MSSYAIRTEHVLCDCFYVWIQAVNPVLYTCLPAVTKKWTWRNGVITWLDVTDEWVTLSINFDWDGKEAKCAELRCVVRTCQLSSAGRAVRCRQVFRIIVDQAIVYRSIDTLVVGLAAWGAVMRTTCSDQTTHYSTSAVSPHYSRNGGTSHRQRRA